jgi:AcrR family transcriptional regulator
MDQHRGALLKAARQQLEANGWGHFTVDAIARQAGVSRQTAHNLFGTKTRILEALFDAIADEGGLKRMPQVMQERSSERLLAGFVEIFAQFWVNDRVLIRRIHGIAAIDTELGAIVHARNQRRRMAATRIVERLGWARDKAERSRQAAILYALTSFEFFDALLEEDVQAETACQTILEIVQRALFNAPVAARE